MSDKPVICPNVRDKNNNPEPIPNRSGDMLPITALWLEGWNIPTPNATGVTRKIYPHTVSSASKVLIAKHPNTNNTSPMMLTIRSPMRSDK